MVAGNAQTLGGPQSEWMNLIRRSLIRAPENDGRYHHLPTETPCPDQFTNILQIPLPPNDEHVGITGLSDPPKSNKNVPDIFFGPALDISATNESQFIDRSEDMTRNPDHIQVELEQSPVIFPDPFPTESGLRMYPTEMGFFHGGEQPSQDPWDQPNDGTGCLQPQQLDQFDQFNILDPGCFTPGLFPDDSNNQSGIYGCVNYETGSSTMVGQSVSSSGLEEYGHELPDSSGGTSTSNVDFDDSTLLRTSSWRHVPPTPPMRTYTKVQKTGSVGRSVDVTTFMGYDELCSAIEHMFGLEGLLSDQRSSGWKLVYVDYERDVLLVGDDPWEEFVLCVRCIRILSPAEVHQMSEEGMQLLSNIGVGCPV